MTDEVTVRSNGKAEMAYVGEVPWHGLGTELKKGGTIEEWRTAAGFDFKIGAAPVQYWTPQGVHKYGDRVVLYREDNALSLGLVSNRYKIVQPGDILDYFAKLAENSGFELETAGTLFGGKKYWAMARIGKPEVLLNPHDKVKAFLLLTTSTDGSSPTVGKFGTVRVVCNNTLSAFMRESGRQSRQTHKSLFSPDKMNKVLGIKLEEQFHEAMVIFRKLAKTPMSKADMVRSTVLTFEPEIVKMSVETLPEELPKILKNKTVKTINDLALTNGIIGANLLTHDTTAIWLNAVTQYIDHSPGSRSVDRAANQALFDGWGVNTKARAFALAQDFSEGNRPEINGVSDDMLMEMVDAVHK